MADERKKEKIEKDSEIKTEEKPEVKEEKKVPDKPKIDRVADLPNVGPLSAEKLAKAGFFDVLSVAVASPSQLSDACGFGEAVARKTIQAAREGLDMGFSDAKAVEIEREKVLRIPTGVKAFDVMMQGGFETGCITECFGKYGSAKTQIAHQLCINVQKLEKDAVAVYIDTEGSFRPSRLREMAKGAGMDEEDVLRRVKVAKAYNSDHQMLLAQKVIEIIAGNEEEGIKPLNVKLVIVDSLTSLFRSEFIGRGTLAERQQKLNKHMSVLTKLADQHNLCVYVTNQVMAKPDAFFGDPTESVGGHIVAHASTFRIYLRPGKKGTRVAKLIDAPNIADGEAPFNVTTNGLEDV